MDWNVNNQMSELIWSCRFYLSTSSIALSLCNSVNLRDWEFNSHYLVLNVLTKHNYRCRFIFFDNAISRCYFTNYNNYL